MRDLDNQAGESPAQAAGSPADRSRRAFVRKAALIGVPVVLATIPSRTVWAKPKRALGGPVAGPAADSAGGSINPSGNTSSTARVKSLF